MVLMALFVKIVGSSVVIDDVKVLHGGRGRDESAAATHLWEGSPMSSEAGCGVEVLGTS